MVLAAAEVDRWVQPDLIEKKTVGDALVALLGAGESEVSGFADAAVVLGVGFPAGAELEGFASVAILATDAISPVLSGLAVANIVSDALTDDYHAAAGDALVPVVGLCFVDVVVDGPVLFDVQDFSAFAVEVTGDAEVAFGDFGMDVPIFPMTFPFQFLDRSLLRFGDAPVAVGGVGVVDAVAVDGPATVRMLGKVKLSFQGSIPVFPFGFPAVFDNSASVRLGTALVELGDQLCSTEVAVEANASVPIYGASNALRNTIFSFTFPAIFDNGNYNTGDAYIAVDGVSSAAAAVDCVAEFGMSAFMFVGSSAVFPWTFGVMFE